MPNPRFLATLDFETTGVNPQECRPVSVAFGVVRCDGVLLERHRLTEIIDAGVDVPPEAAGIHGLTTERCREEGKPVRGIVVCLVAALELFSERSVPVVIFNAPFDWTLLHYEARRVGVRVPACHLIDPLVLDRHLDKWRKGKRTLLAMCEHYGIPLDAAHQAETDATAAARLAFHLLQAPDIRDLSFEELHEKQRVAYAIWRDDFARYLKNQGKPTDDLETQWWPGGLSPMPALEARC